MVQLLARNKHQTPRHFRCITRQEYTDSAKFKVSTGVCIEAYEYNHLNLITLEYVECYISASNLVWWYLA